MANSQVVSLLNKQLANWSVLYVKLHHFHWYVKGTGFFVLHEKFEDLYDKAADYIDDLAERALALKGKPLSTMQAFLENASVKEAGNEQTAQEMVQSLLQDLETVISETKDAMKQAEQQDDEGTADMFLGIVKDMEKQAWFFRSYLEEGPGQSRTNPAPRPVYYGGRKPNIGSQQ